MSESAPTNNNVAESNGGIVHPAFNGGTEDQPSNYLFYIDQGNNYIYQISLFK